MGTEIERKFLVRDTAWRQAGSRTTTIVQGYFAAEQATIRVRIEDDDAYLTFKGRTVGITRSEWEYAIPRADAEELIECFCGSRLIRKVRHYVDVGSHTWTIDEFSGRHEGLCLAEIELQDVDEPFESPDWLGEEVSDEPRYYNEVLANSDQSSNAR